MYHLCQNSQLQTFTCPLGQTFNHITSQCEDLSTVNCIETLEDHSDHQHHHHHRRSVKQTQNVRDRKLFKAALGKKVQRKRTKRSNMIPEDLRGARKLLASISQEILKYCIHYESCNSSRIANVSSTPFLTLDLHVANLDLPVTDHGFFETKYIVEYNKQMKDFLRSVFMQYFNIAEDEFLTFYFDDMLMRLTEKYALIQNKEISKMFKKNAEVVTEVDKIVTEKHTEKYSISSEAEKRRRSFANRLAALYQMILIYCKDYESCDSSRLANASRWGTEILGDWNVTKLESEYPGASIYALLKILEDNKEMTDILRQKFMSYFNISEDVFLTVLFDF